LWGQIVDDEELDGFHLRALLVRLAAIFARR
jgi:hypothetical protein